MNERFVTQEENDSIVKNVFMVIGYSFLSILMIILLAWGYYTSQYLFIAVFLICFNRGLYMMYLLCI